MEIRSTTHRIVQYINPLERFGQDRYSFLFPLVSMLVLYGLSEFFANFVFSNPASVGGYVIFLSVAGIIYFAARDGILGGFTATTITIMYYFYIMYTRNYSGAQLKSGIDATLMLSIVYLLLAGTIGWLKQTVDTFIEREANEKQRLLTIINQLPVGVMISDAKGVLVQANQQLEKMLNINFSSGYIAGKDLLLKSKHFDRPTKPSDSPIAQVLATGNSIVNKEFVIEKKRGKKMYLQVTASPIHNKYGRVIAVAEIITDMTKDREIEQRKDDFVNMASHELKTPITSMKLYIHSLRKKLEITNDPKALKTLESIQYQTVKLQEIVSDLLDVSRLQTGKLTFNMEYFDLNELISETIETLQATAKEQSIMYFGKDSVMVYADRFRIYQVLTNLITNSLKYSAQKQKINIRVKKEAKKVTVSVQDFGVGILKEDQDKIFERLYQVADDMKKTFPGFGMGLYISKEIIKSHKGKIWVESHPNKGSTFSFTLPLKKLQ